MKRKYRLIEKINDLEIDKIELDGIEDKVVKDLMCFFMGQYYIKEREYFIYGRRSEFKWNF